MKDNHIRKDVREKSSDIIKLYLKDKISMTEIARQMNCSFPVIQRILKINNITVRPKILNLPKEEIIDLYLNKNLSQKKIAEKFDCAKNVIRRILLENNITIKPMKFYIQGKPNNKRRINLDEQKVIDLYLNGLCRYKIAKTFNCDSCVIERILKENNIPINPQGFYIRGKESKNRLKLDEEKVIEMYNEDITGNKIAEHFNCSQNIIYHILAKNNIYLKGAKYFNKDSPTKFKKGEEHPNWLNGKSFEPYGIEFNKQLKNQIRKRDNQVCMNCGIHREKIKEAFNIHHINYDKTCNLEQNLISLCNKCHALTNFNREYWTKLLQDKISKLYNYNYDENRNIILDLRIKNKSMEIKQ